MSLRRYAVLFSIAATATVLGSEAHAMTLDECSAKFKSAKDANTLNGTKWSEFREKQCGLGTTNANAANTNSASPSAVAKAPIPPNVTFPNSIDSKFSAETPARQRMKTCLNSYHSNKSANTLSGMRWIQKGGGYYSVCNARLLKNNS
jgi:hypothetical protein